MLQTWHTKTNKWFSKLSHLLILASCKIGSCKQEILLFLSFVLIVSKEKVTKIIKFNWGHLCLFIITNNINSKGHHSTKENIEKIKEEYTTWIKPHNAQKTWEARENVFASTYKASRSFSDTCIILSKWWS